METIGIIFSLIAIAQPFILVVGLIRPQWVLPDKSIKRKRLMVFCGTTTLFVMCSAIAGSVLPDHSPEVADTEQSPSNNDGDAIASDTIIVPPHIVDSIIASSYGETFDSLYNKLIQIDNLEAAFNSRKSIHTEIQKLLFNDWWNVMEQIDSTRQNLPLSRNKYTKSCKKYDKQYARFLVYGNEDIESVIFWTKIEANTILAKLAVDPESLVIERISCNGKTKNGYKCRVIYRARNGFGGYVREHVTLIMAYDMDGDSYKCINII